MTRPGPASARMAALLSAPWGARAGAPHGPSATALLRVPETVMWLGAGALVLAAAHRLWQLARKRGPR